MTLRQRAIRHIRWSAKCAKKNGDHPLARELHRICNALERYDQLKYQIHLIMNKQQKELYLS